MAIYRVQRLFADQAQISDLQKKISEAQAAGKDTSSLQRMLTRAQGDIAKETANAGRTMVAGQGIGATAVADTSNAKTAATNIENAAKTVQNSSAQQSFIKGQNSVGLKQGALNTWNKMGTAGKAGVIGAGLLGTGLMVKGLMGSSSNKEAAFSEDGNSEMGTLGKTALGAAVIGGAGIVGGGLLAKAGKLGVRNQKMVGTGLAKIGNMVGSQALVNSGAKTVGKAAATRAARSYNIPLSREGARIIKSGYGEEARDVFKNIAKQRVAAKQGILDKYSIPAKQVAFSEDTGAALQEAAIYGTLGTGILGAGYLAKKGILGKTGKRTYESASKKVKTIWNETKKPEIKVGEAQTQTVQVKKKSKSGQTTTTTETTTKELGKPGKTTIETTAKKVKFTPEDWPKVLKVIKEKGMDPSNPAHKLAAAKIAGVKPFSIK